MLIKYVARMIVLAFAVILILWKLWEIWQDWRRQSVEIERLKTELSELELRSDFSGGFAASGAE